MEEELDSSWAFISPLIFPQQAHALRRATPLSGPERSRLLLESIKFLIIFWTRLLIDFGSFWGAILGSCSALWVAKLGYQVRFVEKNCFLKKRAPCGPQHDLGDLSGPRSAQDGSKRLLKSNFFALENRLKF